MSYFADDSGTMQVYVSPFPSKANRWQISNDGGMYPTWSRGGRELLYRTADNQIMVAAYTVNGELFAASKPRPWSGKRLANVGQWRNFDLAPDGRRILALLPVDTPDPELRATFLLNFFDEIQRRVRSTR